MRTVSQISEQFNCSEQYIRKLIREGKIEAERRGKTWAIPDKHLKDITFEEIKRTNSNKVMDRISKVRHSKRKLNVLSFFSGAMGLDLGLKNMGMNILLACENDEATRKTIVSNEKNIGLIGDLLSYGPEEILKFSNLKSKDQVDVIIGGPPCQAFSTAGKRMGFQDQRGNAFLKYLDIIKAFRPKYIVIENVRGLMSTPITIDIEDKIIEGINTKETKGSSLYFVKRKLEEFGYKVSFNLYNAANFGVPQVRERIVIIGTLAPNAVPYLTPTHSENGSFGLTPWRTFKEAVEGLDKRNALHINFPEKRLKYLKMLKAGQNWKDLPQEIQPIAMGNSYLLGGGKTGFYRRIAWDRPSPTLVTHPAMPATELAHPALHRPLSVQEYKRLQQFPDEWLIQGSTIDQYRQIGNAVPVGLGEAIGCALKDHHKGITKKKLPDFPYSRYKCTSDVEWESEFIKKVEANKYTLIAKK